MEIKLIHKVPVNGHWQEAGTIHHVDPAQGEHLVRKGYAIAATGAPPKPGPAGPPPEPKK